MTDKDGYESLLGRFNIDKLDVTTRGFAGVYGYGKIYTSREHIEGIGQCLADNPHREKKMTLLHFIKGDGNMIAFIDCLAIFSKVPVEEVVEAIKKLMEVAEIYEYRHPTSIRLIHRVIPEF